MTSCHLVQPALEHSEFLQSLAGTDTYCDLLNCAIEHEKWSRAHRLLVWCFVLGMPGVRIPFEIFCEPVRQLVWFLRLHKWAYLDAIKRLEDQLEYRWAAAWLSTVPPELCTEDFIAKVHGQTCVDLLNYFYRDAATLCFVDLPTKFGTRYPPDPLARVLHNVDEWPPRANPVWQVVLADHTIRCLNFT